MKLAIALVALLSVAAVASASDFSEEEYRFLFVKWAKQFGREYEREEFFHRYNIFRANLDMITEHNKGGHSHTLAMNEFGDLTEDEFRATKLGYAQKPVNSYLKMQNTRVLSEVGLPASVDWATAGKLTPVKNQGQCGSCWSFSTTGSIEGCASIAADAAPISLSEQDLVDCSTSEGNQGCNGGLMDDAFSYVIKAGGLVSEASYPYTATGPNQCQAAGKKLVTSISGYKDVTPKSESQLKAAVAQQPVSVAVCAASGWQFYSGGVMSSCCTQLDHGVLAAGYGTDSGSDYWLVKNSWGPSWGEAGYIRLARNTGGAGTCGIATTPSYPTGCKQLE